MMGASATPSGASVGQVEVWGEGGRGRAAGSPLTLVGAYCLQRNACCKDGLILVVHHGATQQVKDASAQQAAARRGALRGLALRTGDGGMGGRAISLASLPPTRSLCALLSVEHECRRSKAVPRELVRRGGGGGPRAPRRSRGCPTVCSPGGWSCHPARQGIPWSPESLWRAGQGGGRREEGAWRWHAPSAGGHSTRSKPRQTATIAYGQRRQGRRNTQARASSSGDAASERQADAGCRCRAR